MLIKSSIRESEVKSMRVLSEIDMKGKLGSK